MDNQIPFEHTVNKKGKSMYMLRPYPQKFSGVSIKYDLDVNTSKEKPIRGHKKTTSNEYNMVENS